MATRVVHRRVYRRVPHNEHGQPGQHKEPVTDLAHLYARAEAWGQLGEWERRHPNRNFSMRRMTSVSAVLDALAPGTAGDGVEERT